MKFDHEVELNGKTYKFESIEDDPLIFEMTINKDYKLYRHINCDEPTEYMSLVHYYTSVSNGVSKPDTFSDRVYSGKEITSEIFMKELLEQVLWHLL